MLKENSLKTNKLNIYIYIYIYVCMYVCICAPLLALSDYGYQFSAVSGGSFHFGQLVQEYYRFIKRFSSLSPSKEPSNFLKNARFLVMQCLFRTPIIRLLSI